MTALAEQMKFEEAQELKEKYLLLEKYKAKSVIVSTTIHSVDVFSYEESDNQVLYVNYLHVRNGSIVQSYTIEYRKRLDESREEILSLAIAEMRNRFKSSSREITRSVFTRIGILKTPHSPSRNGATNANSSKFRNKMSNSIR